MRVQSSVRGSRLALVMSNDCLVFIGEKLSFDQQIYYMNTRTKAHKPHITDYLLCDSL